MTVVARSARMRRLLGSMSWATADQILSALSNFVITIAVVRAAGADGLGRFSIAFAAYLAVLGFSRSLVSEPLLAQQRAGDDRRAESAAVTLTIAFACLGTIVIGLVGLLLTRPELVAIALVLPAVLLHDVLRYLAFHRQRPRLAALLDGGWLLASCAAWPVVTTTASITLSVVCWACGSLTGAGLAWRRLRPRMCGPSVALEWWRRNARPLAVPLLLDSLLVTLSLQATVIALAAAAGDAGLGLLRAGQVLFAPLGMVLTAVGVLAVPRLAQRPGTVTARAATILSCSLTAVAVLACLVLLAAQPHLRELLFAGTVTIPAGLLAALAVQVIVSAAAGGFAIVAKARRDGAAIARSRLASTAAGIAFVVAAAATFGVEGAAWATAAQAIVYLACLAILTCRADARRQVRPDDMESIDVKR